MTSEEGHAGHSMAKPSETPLHGPPAGKCNAKKRQGGDPCGLSAGFGTDHVGTGSCKFHGGSSPSGRIAGRRALERQAAEAAVRAYGLPVDVDPGSALLAEVQRTAGHVEWLAAKIAAMDPDALIRGTRSIRRQVGKSAEGPVDLTTTDVGPVIHAYLTLYIRERDHMRKVCTDALKAGIAERQVQLAEQAGERAGQWLQAAMGPLQISPAQMDLVLAAGVANLHLLSPA